jgi:hypothetical protein
MRTAESKCLLCLLNDATQTNSHIVPKFLSKPMFATARNKRGYIVGKQADTVILAQDSSKEDFLLCPGCEKYFGLLETDVSQKVFRQFWSATPKLYTDQLIGEFKCRYCTQVVPKIFHLFLQSLIWRCSACSSGVFEKFKLPISFQEELRLALLAYKATTAEEMLNVVTAVETPFPSINYVLLTKENRGDPTATMLGAVPRQEPYVLILCEYQLVFSRHHNQLQAAFGTLNINVSGKREIRIVRNERGWNQFMRVHMNNLIGMTVDQAKKNNTQPFWTTPTFQKLGQDVFGKLGDKDS